MKILVTGGAGYIGSHMTRSLLDNNHEVVIVDSLERGYKEAIDERAEFRQGNLLDKSIIQNVFKEFTFDAIIHFAAYISVEESMEKPALYFENNVQGALHVLEGMVANNVKKIIFSSTAAVYGNPKRIPIPEDHPKEPTNVYGESKLMVEKILYWYRNIYNISYTALRYFNACGASLDSMIGERHDPEVHIIPNAINSLLKNTEFTLFGNDYKTPDGSCVRDYIHVLDLVEAHILALNRLSKEDGGFVYNVGTGAGYSNMQIIDSVNKAGGGCKIKVKIADRRAGDPDTLIADPSKIKAELGFVPKYSNLETIIKTALDWHKKALPLSV